MTRRRWVRTAIAVIVLTAFLYAGRRHFDALGKLQSARPWLVAAIAAVWVGIRLLNAEILHQSLRLLGHNVGRLEAFMLIILRNYTGFFVPRAGLGAAGIYLKKRHGVSFAEYGSLLLPVTVLELILVGALGLGCQIILARRSAQPIEPVVAVLFAVTVVAGLTGLLLPGAVPSSWHGRVELFAQRLSASWRTFAGNFRFILLILGIQLIKIVLRATKLQLAFMAVRTPADTFGVFIASLLAHLMFLVSVTPQGLGFKEAAIVYSARLTGTTASASLAAALLDRVVSIPVVIVVAQIGLWYLMRRRDPPHPASPAGGH